MQRPVTSIELPADFARRRSGYTLIEILVATTLTLILMGAVVQIFGLIGTSVSDSRSTLELSDRLRATAARLQNDLAGVTVTMLPPRRPEADEGYFEYTEGPIGPVVAVETVAVNSDTGLPDTTVGDFDDVLMFTTRSKGRPFVGKYWDPVARGPSTIESHVAEVAWFVRGRTLYRRVLLVAPGALILNNPMRFYAQNDISVRRVNNKLVANTLSDLTRHECRFAHRTTPGWPSHPHLLTDWATTPPTPACTKWATVGVNLDPTVPPNPLLGLGLPTLRECSSAAWRTGDLPQIGTAAFPLADRVTVDLWNQPHPWPDTQVDPTTGTFMPFFDLNSPRVAEDVILTNVIGFDVRAWDPRAPVVLDNLDTPADETDDVLLMPGDPRYITALAGLVGNRWSIVQYGAYVDLNYLGLRDPQVSVSPASLSAFAGRGDSRSGMVRVYDTWSFHYEHDGIDQDQDGIFDEGTNGFDDDDDGVVDDGGKMLEANGIDEDGDGTEDEWGEGVDSEMETSPPYPVPLRGIQVKLRVFEPDSRQIREVTIVQDFLPK